MLTPFDAESSLQPARLRRGANAPAWYLRWYMRGNRGTYPCGFPEEVLHTSPVNLHLLFTVEKGKLAGRFSRRFSMKPMVQIKRRASGNAIRKAIALLVVMAGTQAALAQAPGAPNGSNTGSSNGSSSSNGSGSSTNNGGSSELGTALQAQQQLAIPGPPLNPSSSTTQNGDSSFRGSIVSGKATAGVLPLGLDDAMQRGLRTNLGLILQSSNQRQANGQRLEELQSLLPTVTGSVSITVEQIDLAAEGLKFPGINPIIGPFQVEDFRAYLTQNLVNLNAFQTYLASKHNFQAAKLSAQDARDLVVLTVGNAYLLCVADEARIQAVQAELDSAKLSFDQATAAHEAGTSPRIDALREQVDYQSEEQSLIAATNQFAKDKLSLARVIGLPLDQQFELSDAAPFQALDTPDPEAAFQQALTQRKDLAAAAEQTKAAEAGKRAAFYDQLPTLTASGNFGDIGETVGHSHGTYLAEGQISAPILQIPKIHGEEEVAGAQLDQARAKLSDQVQQVNADVRDAILDIQTAAKLVDAAKSNVDLAREALSEAQQRFKAGVADSLPVSQALATDRQAEDQYISALYQHNVAKLSLARALGVASTNYKDYLGGK
jgi:outer membrane protein TolC